MDNKLLVLLSDSLVDFLKLMIDETDNEICKELLKAHYDIINYNSLVSNVEDFLNTDYYEDYVKVKDLLLNSINSRITDFARQLTLRPGTFEISFLPKDKEPVYTYAGVWNKQNRQTGKPIRIIQKLIKKKFTNLDYEFLNNQLKARLVEEGEFTIVEGEDIRKYYNCANNNSGGTLENSCMRYSECQKYLDLYVDNAKMLVLLNKVTDKISGRAIIWEIDGETYMDRVYYTKDYLLDQYISYAKEHKWHYREYNSLLESGEDQAWYRPEDNYVDAYHNYSLKIKLKKDYDYYPYIDSFRYLYDGTLYCCVPDYDYSICDCTDGNVAGYTTECCEECGYEERYDLEDSPNNLFWSNHDECYYCYNCCTYCDEVDDYVLEKDLRSVITNNGMISLPIWRLEDNEEDYIFVEDEWYTSDYHKLKYNEEDNLYYIDED